ncbi:MAG: divalent-cation tolerance protein CutA [Verrucomicrobiae bacterium]|nr:divalent-cation tolerance protein CutA [Verrucomicrobiae bacterium]
MKRSRDYVVALVTAPDLKTARKLARCVLEAKLIACANLVRNVESHYWWQGKIESSSEVLLVMKTVRNAVGDLEKLITSKHPYDTPEFIVLNLAGGNERYLRWLDTTVAKR